MTDVTLGQVAKFTSGGTPSRKRQEFYDGQIPWITGADIDAGGKVSARSFITHEAVAGSAASIVPAGTIVLVTRTSVGKVGVVSEAGSSFSQDITAIHHNPTLVDRDFLVHYLRSQDQHFSRRARGATIKGVTREAVAGLPIPLPSLDEQRRIAAILDQADALRTKRREALAHLDDLTQSIFEADQASCAATPTPLSDAFWFQEGPGVRKWQFRESGIKLLNVGNISASGELDLAKTNKHLEPQEVENRYRHFLADAGDLVMASSGIRFDDDGLLRTRAAFVGSQDLPLCMNTSTIRFKAIEGKSHLEFLRVWLQSVEFRSQISRLVTGSAQLNFGPTHLKQLTISLPSVADQAYLAAKLERVRRQRTELQLAVEGTDELLAHMQAQAFQGLL